MPVRNKRKSRIAADPAVKNAMCKLEENRILGELSTRKELELKSRVHGTARSAKHFIAPLMSRT